MPEKKKTTKKKAPTRKTTRSKKVSFKQKITDLLLKEKEDLLKDVEARLKSESSDAKFEIGDLYDIASTERERELSLTFGDRDREKLAEIEAALERIKNGAYGLCEDCEERIEEGRLLAMPFARVCVDCKSKHEQMHNYRRRIRDEGAISISDRLDIEEEEY